MPTQSAIIDRILDNEMSMISHIEFYSNFGARSTVENIANLHAFCRIIPTKSRLLDKITLEFTIPQGTGACAQSTITAVSLDQTQITVADGSIFYSSDETIQIDIAPKPAIRNIIAKSGNILTIDSPLGVASAGGIAVKSLYAQIGIIQNGTSSLNSGDLFRIEAINFFKDNTTPDLPATYRFSLLSN